MKNLFHNGILVLPKYKACGYLIFIKGQSCQLHDKAEEMAFAFVRKKGTPYVQDLIFCRNFFKDFCSELGVPYTEDINFEQIEIQVEKERYSKENMTKEEKKELAKERKKLREERKEKYGYAIVDDNKVEISNYIAEPSSLFMGRGKHPLRGSWKEGPKEEGITLNLSPDAPRPQGNWKGIEWNPKKMYVAKWEDKLSGKTKYVWLSDTWSKKQEKEKAKFAKANQLEKNLKKVEHLIGTGLHSEDKERNKIATVCYLIFNLNLRVGDEKDKDEAETVGAITLRPKNLKFSQTSNTVDFNFLGKDSVEWKKSLSCDQQAFFNLQYWSSTCKNYLFEGITSKDVTKFLQEAMLGLTAKVFRTWKISKTVEEYLNERLEVKSWPLWMKIITAKFANLQGAIIANHKRKVPDKFKESLERKKEKKKKLQLELSKLTRKDKGWNKKVDQLSKIDLEIQFALASRDYTLGTSLKSYINPTIFKEWMDNVDLPYEKVYNKTLLKKYSWVFN